MSSATSSSRNDPTTTLCDTCNRNQEMKMYQLRQFTPVIIFPYVKIVFKKVTKHYLYFFLFQVNPKNEDQELQAYQDHLERTYRLCRVCEAKVRQVLGEQDSKLKQKFLAWKLALFR